MDLRDEIELNWLWKNSHWRSREVAKTKETSWDKLRTLRHLKISSEKLVDDHNELCDLLEKANSHHVRLVFKNMQTRDSLVFLRELTAVENDIKNSNKIDLMQVLKDKIELDWLWKNSHWRSRQAVAEYDSLSSRLHMLRHMKISSKELVDKHEELSRLLEKSSSYQLRLTVDNLKTDDSLVFLRELHNQGNNITSENKLDLLNFLKDKIELDWLLKNSHWTSRPLAKVFAAEHIQLHMLRHMGIRTKESAENYMELCELLKKCNPRHARLVFENMHRCDSLTMLQELNNVAREIVQCAKAPNVLQQRQNDGYGRVD